MLHSLKDISVELSLQPFSLREFLSQNGLTIALDEGLECANVSDELYWMIKKTRSRIETQESLRIAELEFKIQYLQDKLFSLDKADYHFGMIHEYLQSELQLAKGVRYFREFEEEEVHKSVEGASIGDGFHDDDADYYTDSNTDDDGFDDDTDDDDTDDEGDTNEYSIYNSNGFVTWTFNLKQARRLASQFNGYIKDDYGREVS